MMFAAVGVGPMLTIPIGNHHQLLWLSQGLLHDQGLPRSPQNHQKHLHHQRQLLLQENHPLLRYQAPVWVESDRRNAAHLQLAKIRRMGGTTSTVGFATKKEKYFAVSYVLEFTTPNAST